MLRSRELRHRLELQKQATGPGLDEYGHEIVTWVTVTPFFGSFQQLSASEQVVAQQQNSQATHKITTHYMPSFKPTTAWRIKFGERLLFISSITNVDELNREWIFQVGELLNVSLNNHGR